MARAQISNFKITTSTQVISQRVRKAIRDDIKAGAIYNKTEKISREVAQFLYEKFLSSSTYFSLTGGTLRAEFGLDNAEAANIQDAIIDIIAVNTHYNFNNGQIRIIIKLIDENLDLSTTGSYTYTNKKGKTYTITWLLWLLTAGENVVVPDHVVYLQPGQGRSEMAIMIKPDIEGSYSVDPEYSGTPNDNWITRTIRNNIEEIKGIVIGILKNGA